MWWGSEPAHLKGLLDRVLLPGLTFAYHDDDNWWDKLMEGRSADVIATMDTPPLFLRLMYGNALIKRWKLQVLGFCGFKPVRFLALRPVKHGEADKPLPKWRKRIENMARTESPSEAAKKRARLKSFLNR
ncbi:MAG: flavodoxin family protein [Altererythrobacter sp.]|jgi:NAD(P)H dehydrogenase (quinone)|nr:flavodoxin family protein [Altererythrobacter sp.]